MADRWYRSETDKMVAGVAGGLARRFDIDPSIIRVVWAVSIVMTGGITLVAYIVIALVVPYAPDGYAWPSSAVEGTDPATGGATFGATRRSRDRDRNSAGLLAGIVLIGIGVLFLVRELIPAIDLTLSWPVLAVIVGVALVILSIRPRRSPG